MTAGDRQAIATSRLIVHVTGVVRQINERAVNTLPGVVWGGVLGRFTKAFLVIGQFGNHLLDVLFAGGSDSS